jgi:predicted nucleotidyltransferase component of viral defense system
VTRRRKVRARGDVPKTDLDWLRRQFIVALAADGELFELLVLKGGSALSLVHRIGLRASIDIDYSIEADAPDPKALGERIFAALRARVEPQGYVLFDGRFAPRGSGQRWGGYTAEFKLISRERFDPFGGDLGRVRKASLASSTEVDATRRFRIEISTFEYCAEKTKKVVEDGQACYVYTPQMIAAEKLRSLCQQMKGGGRAHPAPRARDFYDLHALLTEGRVELSEGGTHEVVRAVFEAKEVPLEFLADLENYREFHRSDWPAVLNAIPGSRPRLYDFYFDFVLGEVRKLQPLWVVDAP